MSKAVLVIDMPRSCEECMFCSAVGECKFLDDVDESIANGSKDLRCPLKPLIRKEDAISREEVYRAIITCGEVDNDLNHLYEVIENFSSVIPKMNEGEWIPCSERLPSERGDYLVTFPLCDGEPCVYMLSFNKGKFYETDDEWGDVQYVDVTAWMPLPEPWKGAEE